MKLLEDRIKAGGRALSESVLKVDVFLNHQVDPDLMQEVGKDFFEHFKDFGITRVFIIDELLDLVKVLSNSLKNNTYLFYKNKRF